MTARVSTDGAHESLQAVVLKNELFRAVVLPELGGKLWQLTGLRIGPEFLWHNAQLQPGQVPFGATYDDNFFGGWDEVFPNDVPEELTRATGNHRSICWRRTGSRRGWSTPRTSSTYPGDPKTTGWTRPGCARSPSVRCCGPVLCRRSRSADFVI
jgi:hypothetical protein